MFNVMQLAACIIIFVGSIIASVAGFAAINAFMSPLSNGIEVKFLSAATSGNEISVAVSIRDVIGGRLSYLSNMEPSLLRGGISMLESSSLAAKSDIRDARLVVINYDASSETAYAAILARSSNEFSEGDNIELSIKGLLMGSMNRLRIESELDLIKMSERKLPGTLAYALQLPRWAPLMLPKDGLTVETPPLSWLKITNAGYIEEQFHLQYTVSEEALKYNFKGFHLLLKDGEEQTFSSYSFKDQGVGRSELVFDISPSALAESSLALDYCPVQVLSGEWKVKFILTPEMKSNAIVSRNSSGTARNLIIRANQFDTYISLIYALNADDPEGEKAKKRFLNNDVFLMTEDNEAIPLTLVSSASCKISNSEILFDLTYSSNRLLPESLLSISFDTEEYFF
ncbi:MAG: hypothetical protein LBU32_15700 [Clostridiales bacterium]|jgi:hypothetical protein|nr:hypothetical protein [Clostridiales bacterium]